MTKEEMQKELFLLNMKNYWNKEEKKRANELLNILLPKKD